MTMSQPTTSAARVQTQGGQTVPMSQIQSVKLADGQWHSIDDLQVSYGEGQSVPLGEILAFSDRDESGGDKQPNR